MKLKEAFKITFMVAIAFLVFAGCGKKNAERRNDTVLQAYRLIDEQRLDEAIELLEQALSNEPTNSEYKAVLASAYAGKAGIKIQKLIPVLNQSDKFKELSSELPEISKEQSAGARINAGALNIATLLGRFAGFFEAYASIPMVEKNQAIYLNQGIYLLNDIGKKIKPEDVLYRAVLEIVLLKHIIAEGLMGELIEPQTKDGQTCRLDVGKINDTVMSAGKLLIDIYYDIGFANPNLAYKMKNLAEQTSDSISNFTIATTAVTTLDEVSNIFLKETAIQIGFGKIIKCGGD